MRSPRLWVLLEPLLNLLLESELRRPFQQSWENVWWHVLLPADAGETMERFPSYSPDSTIRNTPMNIEDGMGVIESFATWEIKYARVQQMFQGRFGNARGAHADPLTAGSFYYTRVRVVPLVLR